MLTLTPNRRLAAFLVAQYNQQQAAKNLKSWPTPQIYPLEAWLNELWQLCGEKIPQAYKPILNTVQQQVLWEQLIQQSKVGAELLRITATAKNALQAWKFLSQWQVSIEKLSAYAAYSEDTSAFCSWLQLYMQWLEANNYLDFNLMVDQLLIYVPQLVSSLPTEICLMGIDDMPPQYSKFFEISKLHGINITHKQLVQPGAKISKAGFADVDQELQAAADWAQQILLRHPQHIIGIVVPELENLRPKVVREFSKVFAPELLNISAPLTIANYALINSALLILHLAKDVIDYSEFSMLLRSPYIRGAAQEINLRALLDRQLREKVEAKINWQILLQKTANLESGLNALINTFQDAISELKGKHRAEYWVKKLQRLLACWGWPGERGLTIEETHLLSCWQDLLQKYGQLAVVVEEHTFNQALQIIQRIASETPFLPAETGLTKLHILGVLEGAGLLFDHLWVTGMSRDTWPPDSAPNPFIPLELQRQVDMPRSSPQRELKVARRLTATLRQGAKHAIMFSYPQMIEEHVTEATNLLSDIPIVYYMFRPVQNLIKFDLNLEIISDSLAPALVNFSVPGGAKVLKLQAQCPFKAFAEIRLNAKHLEEPSIILTAADRGNIVHDVLEKFWRQCASHSQLTAYVPEALTAILSDIIDRVLTRYKLKRPYTLQENYKFLERNRLLALISRWLEYESTREPFTVQKIEHKLLINIGPLILNLRIDRLDRIDNGMEILIDYKTGTSQINSWFADRITEPQLPLYTAELNQSLAGLTLANIKADDLSFNGVSAEDNLLPNVRALDKLRYISKASTWDEQLAQWNNNLSQTAKDFAAGVAMVDPYSSQECKLCKLQALCRIYDC